MVLYDHDSNTILAEPLTSRSKRELIQANRVLHSYLSACSLTPQYQMLDNECPGGLKQFLRNSSVNFQLVPPHLHHTNTVERAIQPTRITSSPVSVFATLTPPCISGTASFLMLL